MKVMLSLFILLILVSCASNKALELQTQAKESTVNHSQALGQSINELIHSSSKLNAAQKKELEGIFKINKNKADELTEKSFQYRSVLIKSLLSGNYNQNDVSILKKNIEKIEKLKLKNTFDTVEKVTNIVNKHEKKDEFADYLLMMDKRNK